MWERTFRKSWLSSPRQIQFYTVFTLQHFYEFSKSILEKKVILVLNIFYSTPIQNCKRNFLRVSFLKKKKIFLWEIYIPALEREVT